MRDIIKIYNTDSKEKINTLTPDSLDIGVLALVKEANYERLYCKNTNGEITPIHRIADAGEIQFSLPTIQKEWIDSGLATWIGETEEQIAAMKHVMFITSVTNVPMVSDSDRLTFTSFMFQNCSELTSIPELNTSNVTNMNYMFAYCFRLTEIPELVTSNVTTMIGMFQICSGLTEIPLLDTSKVTDMNSMFGNCSGLTLIPELVTSKVTDMNSMFWDCPVLTEIPLLDTSKVTNMNSMFNGCSVLTTIPLLDTSKVTDMSYMFYGCTGLTEIPLLNTSNVINMEKMFNKCTVLTEIPLIDTSNVTNMSEMFVSCPKLVTCKLKGIKVNLDLENSPLLNVESIRYIMNNSQTVTGRTLTINSTAWVNSGLTDTDPDVVAFKAKGWRLVH